jgi:hypothetical protein
MNKSKVGLTTMLAVSAGAILAFVGMKAFGHVVTVVVVILCIIGLARKSR